MKVRTQLMVFILGVVLLGLGTVISLSYTSSRQLLLSEVYGRAENLREKYQNAIDGYFNSASKVALSLSHIVRIDEGITEKQVHQLLQRSVVAHKEIFGLSIFFQPKPADLRKKLFAPYYYREGQLIKYVPAEHDFKFEKQSWYYEPKKKAMPVWTEPYFDPGFDGIVTSYSVPIFRNRGKLEFVGISLIDIHLGTLSDDINNIQIGKTGYAFLVSHDGVFITHPEAGKYVLKKKIQDVAKEVNETSFTELASLMLKRKSGALSVMDPFTKKMSWVTYGTIPSTNYSLAISVPESELLLSVNELRRKLFLISAITIVFIIIGIVVISWRITHPIEALSESARKIAGGNFDHEIKSLDSNNEIGNLGKDIYKMVETIKNNLGEIRKEKDKFEATFTHMTDGVVATDADWSVINYNRAAEKMMNISNGAHLIFHLSNKFKTNFELQDILDPQKKVKYLELIQSETEQLKEIIYSATINTILDNDKNAMAHILTIRDVTDEKREEKNKSTLLSMVSHKLRTPIAVLKGTVALFQDGILGDLDSKQKDSINMMGRQSNKMHKLVDRLIDYVSLEGANHEQFQLEEFDPNEFWSDFRMQYKFNITDKKLNLNFKLAPELKHIKFNREYLKLIFSELIENAIKFNSNEEVDIDIMIKRENGRLVLEVRDNGIGIPSVHHDQIFDRFFQVDKYFTGNVEGMGLGLALVKTVVENLKGSLRVDSEEGEGSTFVIERADS
jgi:signal transduction histidine kinase